MPRESKKDRIARMHHEYAQLVDLFPDAQCALHYKNPLELLVATVLSAQTTDKRVNIVTQDLFARYKTAEDYASANVGDIENIIHSLGFFRSKAQHLKALGAKLCSDFGGEVPHTMEELVTLPGVGRKTANVVLGNAFGIPGFPVDTHVIRMTGMLRWQNEWRKKNPDPVKIEKQVTACFPPDEWTQLSLRLILLGRHVCSENTPGRIVCPLIESCPTAPHYLKNMDEYVMRKKKEEEKESKG